MKNVTVRLWVVDDGRPARSAVRVEVRANGASATARLSAAYHGFVDPVGATVPRPSGSERYPLGRPGS